MAKYKYKQNVSKQVKDLMNKTDKNGYYLEEKGFVKTKFKPYKSMGGGVLTANLTAKGKRVLEKLKK